MMVIRLGSCSPPNEAVRKPGRATSASPRSSIVEFSRGIGSVWSDWLLHGLNGWCCSCGRISLAVRSHVATTSASRIMVASARLALSTEPAENKGRQLQTRVRQCMELDVVLIGRDWSWNCRSLLSPWMPFQRLARSSAPPNRGLHLLNA